MKEVETTVGFSKEGGREEGGREGGREEGRGGSRW